MLYLWNSLLVFNVWNGSGKSGWYGEDGSTGPGPRCGSVATADRVIVGRGRGILTLAGADVAGASLGALDIGGGKRGGRVRANGGREGNTSGGMEGSDCDGSEGRGPNADKQAPAPDGLTLVPSRAAIWASMAWTSFSNI